jgi:hypothetical protein
MIWFVLRGGVGLVKVVAKPFVVVLVTGKVGLDGAGLADDFRGESAILEFEGRLVLGEILVGLWRSGLKQGNFHARFGEAFARPTTGSSRTNYDGIELRFSFRHNWLPVRVSTHDKIGTGSFVLFRRTCSVAMQTE